MFLNPYHRAFVSTIATARPERISTDNQAVIELLVARKVYVSIVYRASP